MLLSKSQFNFFYSLNLFSFYLYILNINRLNCIIYAYKALLILTLTRSHPKYACIATKMHSLLNLTYTNNSYKYSPSIKRSRVVPLNFFKSYINPKLRLIFTHRNTFFTISDPYERLLKTTSMRKEGFSGRRRKDFTSLLTVLRGIKRSLWFLKIKKFDLIIIG